MEDVEVFTDVAVTVSKGFSDGKTVICVVSAKVEVVGVSVVCSSSR